MPNVPLTKNDIDCFFEEGELCVNAVLKGNNILVIYRETYGNLDAGAVGIVNASPFALLKFDDAIDAVKGDTITIEGDEFYITVVQRNSEYYVKLFLEAV